MFTIPNDVSSGTAEQHSQAGPDSVDFNILANSAGAGSIGVVSGCAVTADGTDLVLTVASGSVVASLGGSAVTVAGNTVTATADSTNPRWALICVNSSGTATITMGTAAPALSATQPGPVFPAVPAGQVPLAVAYVAGGATSLASSDLVDKRLSVVVRLTSPLTTKGDLWGFDTGNNRLPVGSNGFVLEADSTQTLGVGWSTRDVNVNSHKVSSMANGATSTDAVAYGQVAYGLMAAWR